MPCDFDHIQELWPSDKLYPMARKIISALLLLAMAAWAELTLAPFLALHAHAQMVAMNHEDHHPAADAPHPCCPKAHGMAVAPPLYAITAGGLPNADEHRCCFQQAPQSAPAPAGSPSRLSKDLVALNRVTPSPNVSQPHIASLETASAFSPPGDRNMVLRI